MKNTIIHFIAWVSLGACGGTQTLVKDTKPVLVSAEPPTPVVEQPEPPPEPPPRVEVKADRIAVNEAIYFDSSRASIREESHDLLDEIAKVMNAHPELVKIRIEGHTDNIGKHGDNLSLSKRRATAVRMYLIEVGGVDARRLIAEGFGDDNPIATNDTRDGRAKNRRVAFTVLDRNDGAATRDVDDSGHETSMRKRRGGDS